MSVNSWKLMLGKITTGKQSTTKSQELPLPADLIFEQAKEKIKPHSLPKPSLTPNAMENLLNNILTSSPSKKNSPSDK